MNIFLSSSSLVRIAHKYEFTQNKSTGCDYSKSSTYQNTVPVCMTLSQEYLRNDCTVAREDYFLQG